MTPLIISLSILLALTSFVACQTSAPSIPMDVSLVKCFFVIYGEFTQENAKAACLNRNATLATFNSLSEDNIVRNKINWNSVPGYRDGKGWVGQLWLSAKRIVSPSAFSSGSWQWDSPTLPGVPFAFSAWLGGDSTASSYLGFDCLVLQESGWLPHQCDAVISGRKLPAGALCEVLSRTVPGSDVQAASSNYCDVPLMPPSSNNFGLPLVMRKTFFLVQGNFSWETAKQACAANRAQLALLKTQFENEYIFKNVDLMLVKTRAWIGLRRTFRGSRVFVWTDGVYNSNANGFLPGQPDNAFGGNQECVAFMRNDADMIGWADLPCDAWGSPESGRAPIGALCEANTIL